MKIVYSRGWKSDESGNINIGVVDGHWRKKD